MLKVMNIPSENKKNDWQYFWIIGRNMMHFKAIYSFSFRPPSSVSSHSHFMFIAVTLEGIRSHFDHVDVNCVNLLSEFLKKELNLKILV